MKKVTAVLMSIFLSFGLAACGSTQDDRKPEAIDRMVESVETEPSAQPETEIPEENRDVNTEENSGSAEGKALVVYFSMPETSDPDNMTQEEDNSVVALTARCWAIPNMWPMSFRRIPGQTSSALSRKRRIRRIMIRWLIWRRRSRRITPGQPSRATLRIWDSMTQFL